VEAIHRPPLSRQVSKRKVLLVAKPSVRELSGVFFRIGNFTFGGGSATTAALQREIVERRRWYDTLQFGLCYALARVTPGTNLFAFSAASGWLLRGWQGALAALLVVSIPSCVLVCLVTVGFDSWSRNRFFQAAIAGALAASVGALLASFWLLVRPYLDRRHLFQTMLILAGSIALSFLAGWSPIVVLLLAGIAGFFWKEPTK
jgi:chromate transporter